MTERNAHRHGRWTGLFKLSEESGELVVAAIDAMLNVDPEAQPVFIRALEEELADAGAALHHAMEANRLDRGRIAARCARQIARLSCGAGAPVRGALLGLAGMIRCAGQLQQLLGKIAAFPDQDEHPDRHGNLKGRLEAAIADLAAHVRHVAAANGLDEDHLQMRGDDKLEKFRAWFPAEEGAWAEPA